MNTAYDEYVSDSFIASEVPSALELIDAYLGTLGSGRTLVDASEVRNLLLDIRMGMSK